MNILYGFVELTFYIVFQELSLNLIYTLRFIYGKCLNFSFVIIYYELSRGGGISPERQF